jgi:hypothetical protein
MSSTTEETLAAMRREMRPLLETAMEGVLTKARGVLEEAEQWRAEGLAEVAEERAKGLAEVDAERATGIVEVETRRAELHREVATMHKHKEAQEGHVLNIGGYRYETSVQTLRRLPHTFFDAYSSGRHAQEVCADGSIFIDRDGEHFGQVLQYLRDGVVSVAEEDASELDVSLFRWLKREFGFYCIELKAEQQDMAFVAGGADANNTPRATMEHYIAASEVWREAASMTTARANTSLCTLHGAVYTIGGTGAASLYLASVERYDPSLDSWNTA